MIEIRKMIGVLISLLRKFQRGAQCVQGARTVHRVQSVLLHGLHSLSLRFAVEGGNGEFSGGKRGQFHSE